MSPRPHRIMMTTDAVGGVWTFATGLARKLCEAGHAVTLVTLGPRPSTAQLAPLTAVENLSVDITDLALEWMDPEGEDVPRARDSLKTIADRANPDIIHLNSFREALFAFDAPVLVVAHSCVGSWWQACRSGRPDASWNGYLDDVAAGLSAADAWAAPTLSYRDWIEREYRPRRAGLHIWNGTTFPVATGPKQPHILAAGRLWDEAKNIAQLNDIADELDWPLRLAGPIAPPAAPASPSVVATNIRHLGELPHTELTAEMQRAGIFVAPARYEPFGLTILEAAANGCALVLSDIPTLRELWDDAALFVPVDDRAALKAALTSLTRNDGLRTKLQAFARQRAERYSLDATVENYRKLYGSMTSARSRERHAPALELCA